MYSYFDQFDSSKKVGGWFRHQDNFSLIVVPQAGHMVPYFKPYLSAQFVTNFIEKGYLYCETEISGICKTFASDMCDFMNDCNKNGVCNSYGKCQCSSSFFGADCSTQVTDVTRMETNTASVKVSGSRWFYYLVPAKGDDFILTITSEPAVSVYIRKGEIELPDSVNFDFQIKSETQITITSKLMNFAASGIVAVHCKGEPDKTTNFSLQFI